MSELLAQHLYVVTPNPHESNDVAVLEFIVHNTHRSQKLTGKRAENLRDTLKLTQVFYDERWCLHR
ncbi:MAG: hypothetical protein AAF541_20600 [Pseudomonadota bacterium]